MIDTKKKNVEYYAPHGINEMSPSKINTLRDIFCRDLSKDKTSESKNSESKKEDAIHITPNRIRALPGYSFKIITHNFYSKGVGAQSISPYPYCLSWCVYIALLRTLYPILSFEEIDAMTKTRPFDIENESLTKEQMMIPNIRFENLDQCALKSRIELFTVYFHRISCKFYGKKPVDFSDPVNHDIDTVLDIINMVTTNSDIVISDRSSVVPIFEKQKGGNGKTRIIHKKIKVTP